MKQRSRFFFLSIFLPLSLIAADNPAGSGFRNYAIEMTKKAGKVIYDNVTKDVVTNMRQRSTSTPPPVSNPVGSENTAGILQGIYNLGKALFGPSAKEQAHDREHQEWQKELDSRISNPNAHALEHHLKGHDPLEYKQDLQGNLDKIQRMTDAQIAQRERQLQALEQAERNSGDPAGVYRLQNIAWECEELHKEKLSRLKKEVLHTASTALVMNTQTAQTTTTVTETTQTVPTEMSRLEKSIAERAKTIDSIDNGWAGWWTSMKTANDHRDEQAKEKQKLAALQSEDKKGNKDRDPEKKGTDAIAKDSSKNKAVEEYRKHEQQQYEKHTREMQKARKEGQKLEGRNKNYTPRTKATPEKATKPPHESGAKIEFQKNEGQKGHNFRQKEGHFNEGTPEAQQSIKDAIKGDRYRGEDNYGNHHYDYVNENGDQIWAEVRPDGKIKNCGANKIHKPLDSEGFLSKTRGDKLPAIVGGGLSAIASSSDAEAAEIRAQIKATSGIPKLPDAPGISKEERYIRENDQLSKIGLPTIPLPPVDQVSHKEHFSIVSGKEHTNKETLSFTKGKDYTITNPKEFAKVANEYTPKMKSSDTTGWGDSVGWGNSSGWGNNSSWDSSSGWKSSKSGSGKKGNSSEFVDSLTKYMPKTGNKKS